MSARPETQAAAAADIDRRQHPRIAVTMPVATRVVPEGDEVLLLNISEGGFLMRVPSELPHGAIWTFGFTIPSHDPVELRGRIAHAMRATADGNAMYLIGVEFVDDGSDAHRERVRRLIDATQG